MVLHAFFWHAILAQFEVITLAHLGSQSERYSQLRLWGLSWFYAGGDWLWLSL